MQVSNIRIIQVFFKGLEIGDVADHIVGQFY